MWAAGGGQRPTIGGGKKTPLYDKDKVGGVLIEASSGEGKKGVCWGARQRHKPFEKGNVVTERELSGERLWGTLTHPPKATNETSKKQDCWGKDANRERQMKQAHRRVKENRDRFWEGGGRECGVCRSRGVITKK